MDDGNQRLKSLLHQAILSLRAETAWMRMHMAMSGLIEIQRKLGYDPNQPRVPAGNADGGQWSTIGGSSQGSGGNAERLRLAANITGFTKHGINRAIERNISPDEILDAVSNPLKIRPRPNGSMQFIGTNATVVLDPSGNVITMWPR